MAEGRGLPYARAAMLRLFADNLLPVLLAAGVGYLAAARWKLDPRPLARITFNVLAPCLVFQLMVTSRVPATEALRVAAFALAVLLTAALLAGLLARAFGWPRPMIAALPVR